MLRLLIGTTALAGSLVLGSLSASSAPIVANGSFEDGLNGWTPFVFSGTTPGIGITVVETGGTNTTGYGDNVPNYDGTHAVFFVDDNANQTLSQTVTLQANTLYNFAYALFADQSGSLNSFNFTLEDSVGTNIFSTLTNSQSNTAVPVGVWTPYDYNFSVASAGTYLLDFHYTSGSTPAKDVLLDAVAINAVPEPASLALLGAGLLGLGLTRRRKNRAAA